MPETPVFHLAGLARRRGIRALVWAVAWALALGACGGGVEVGGTGSAQGYSEGAITGYGSIVVNGVHYDERAATVQDEDGNPLSPSALLLGMRVRIDSGAIDATTLTATASKVVVASDLLGPVEAVDALAGTVRVLGQTVRLSGATVLGEGLAAGLAGLPIGAVLEVHGLFDPLRQHYTAWRLARVSGTPAAYHLRGPVTQVNTAAQSFNIGPATLRYDTASRPQDLAVGRWLRVQLAPAADALGRWPLQGSRQGLEQPVDGREVEREGVIDALLGASRFTLAGQVVEAGAATLSPAGSTLSAGMRVEVEGRMQSGVLVASRVILKDADDDGEDDEPQRFEFKGRIEALDTGARTLTLRGVLIRYDLARLEDLALADLRVGLRIEVRGQLAPDGSSFTAERISRDD